MKRASKAKKTSFVWWLILLLFVVIHASDLLAQTCVQPPLGMIAWWPFDETSGPVAADIAGTKPGSYFGGVSPVIGRVGNAVRFNGVDGFVGVGDSDLWAFGSRDFTIEFWANFSSPGGGTIGHPSHIFIGNDEGPFNVNKWFFALGGGFLNFHVNGPSVGPQFFPLVPFNPAVNQWYHLAITREGDTFTIYVNGLAGGFVRAALAVPNANAPLTIGQAESLGFMGGALDEMTIYNRALSGPELQAIVSASGAGKCRGNVSTAVVPSSGGDTGRVTVRISAAGLVAGGTVTLSSAGFPDIASDVPSIADGFGTIIATFNLRGQPRGVRDVVITNPAGTITRLLSAFTVVEGRSALTWVDVVGRGFLRVGQVSRFHLLFGNRGNVDAEVLNVWIDVRAANARLTPHFPARIDASSSVRTGRLATAFERSDVSTIHITIVDIPPEFVGSVEFDLTVPSSGEFLINLEATRP